MDDYFVCFEKKLIELFEYLEFLEKIDFEENLLEILNEIIIRVPYMNEIFVIIQDNLWKIFNKNDKNIEIFFFTFIYSAKYGYKFICFENKEFLKQVLKKKKNTTFYYYCNI